MRKFLDAKIACLKAILYLMKLNDMVYFLTQLPRSSAKLVASVTFLVMGLMQEASSVMRMQIAV